VTVKVVSLVDASRFATATITLVAPPLAAGSALAVDAGAPTHAIDPMIYGANSYDLDPVTLKLARFGSDVGRKLHHALQLQAQHHQCGL